MKKPVVTDVTVQEMEELVKGVDLILDATDNFETRLLINDISQKYNIPWIYGGCVGSYGVTYNFTRKNTVFPLFNGASGERSNM